MIHKSHFLATTNAEGDLFIATTRRPQPCEFFVHCTRTGENYGMTKEVFTKLNHEALKDLIISNVEL